jgi:hypothetical protein
VQENPVWQSPSGLLIEHSTPFFPSRQMPLTLLHWFWHSTLRAQGLPSGCFSMQRL